MKKMIVLLKKEGMTLEKFRNHYENIHIPLCGRWIGHLIQDYRPFYPQHLNNLYHGREDEGPGRAGGAAYDAIAAYTIRDEDFTELNTIGQDREFQRLITEDEELFCDRAETLEGSAEEFSGLGING